MNQLAHPLPFGVRVTDSITGLADIHAPDCAAVIWARPDCAAVTDWLAELPADHLPRMREILRPDTIPARLQAVCASLPDAPERPLFIDRIAELAEHFAAAMRAPWLRLRLEVVTGNACRKFHMDNVTARLVCTCRGRGTQFGLAKRDADPVAIHTVPTGQPIVLRGSQWPTTPPSTLRHRSPPIEGTGETRLLLVLDPILDPEDAV